MKKLFLLLALMGMVAVGCSKDDTDKGNDNKTEQPNENEGGNEEDIPENIFFGLDKESVTISPDGGSVDVIVYSNYKWEISGTSDWCTPSVKSGDANEDGQKVTFSADVAYDDREATFWFRCTDKQIKFVVSQKFKEIIIPDANNTFNIPAEGGIAVISYQTSVDCDVIIPEEAQDWITIAPATRGLVSENINLDISENTTYSTRTAVIKVVAKDNAELAVEYTINQEQNDAVLANGNTEFTIGGREQQITIEHKSNIDCDVIIPDEAQDWVTIAPATRGLSTYSTTLNIAENNSDEERSCVIKVTSQGDNELFAEYTIIQNPRYYLYYTSSNGAKVQPYDSSAFGATIISNTYKDDVGVIEFDAPITMIGYKAFYDCYSLTSVTIPDSVTSIGGSAFEYCSSLTSVTIPDSVTTIGDYAFSVCNSLTSVTIGDSVTEIGNYAFRSCSSLTSVTIPDSVTEIEYAAFAYCSSLTSVTIGDSVTTIGDYAFADCNSLISVTIPDSVTTIGEGAFYGCTGELIISSKIVEIDYSSGSWLYEAKFTKLTIGDGIEKIGESAFQGCSSLTSVTIPDSVTEIGGYAFQGCSSLTSVTIPDSVISIGNYAFYDCVSLTSVTIGDSVTTIGNHAFCDCYSLTSVTIPDSVTEIGSLTFANCDSLTGVYISDIAAWCNISFRSLFSNPLYYANNLYLNNELVADLTIPDSVTTIGEWAFAYCSSLTSVTIPDSVTTIGYEAFYCCSSLTSVTIGNSVTTIGEAAFAGCSSLTSVTIPDSVTTIGEWAFCACSSLQEFRGKFASEDGRCLIVDGTLNSFAPAGLTEYTIPNSVTTIGKSAFEGCTSLTSVTIPDSVTTIGDWAFAWCTSLTSVTIPDSVTTIEDAAFYDCSSLTSVYCKATTPPVGGSSMFSGNASGRKIYVPMESVEAYKSASGWSDYKSYIVGYNF